MVRAWARGVLAAAGAAVVACAFATPAQAGPADDVSLIADIAPGPTDSVPQAFATLGDRVIFAATATATGTEPWVTDGTPAGTTLLKDIVPGGVGSLDALPYALEFHVFEGHAYFQADGGPGVGKELYRTDGTPGGTVLFDDMSSGDSVPVFFETMGDHLYFASKGHSAQGTELWRTDGTPGATELVKEILPGAGGGSPNGLTVFNGSLYFSAIDALSGREIFKSDGIPGGTTGVLSDVNPGLAGSDPEQFTEHGGRLYFRATTAAAGAELWSTDGLTGTALVENIMPGADGSLPKDLTSVGGRLYFTAQSVPPFGDRELWRSDGTATGTDEVAEIAAGNAGSSPDSLTAYKDRLFFSAGGPDGYELWQSDGTAAGTAQVLDIVPGPNSSGPALGEVVNGLLYFTATQTGITGTELWRSDGTASGTALVEDYNPGSGSGPLAFSMIGFKGAVFVPATNGTHGYELVRAADTTPPETEITSGPAEGTTVEDTNPTFGFSADEAPANFECSVDGAGFAACSGPGDTHTTAELTAGAHTFSVRATDDVGLIDATPATRYFTISAPRDDDDLPDTAVLDPFVKAKATQNQKDELIVKVKLGAGELVSYVAKGKATVDGEKGGARLAKQTGAVDAGKRVKLKLEAAKSDAGAEILEAIADGEKAEATLKIKLTDQPGNVFKKKLTVALE